MSGEFMRKFLLALTLASMLAASAPAQMPKPVMMSEGMKNAEAITAAEMKDYLYFVASDEMAGRNTPSKELDLTAKFIALNLSRWGLKPGGDNGTYFQTIRLKRNKADLSQSSITIGDKTFKGGDDFLLQQTSNGPVSGALVFAGNGWMIKSKNLDTYTGLDVKDKIVVVAGTGGLPPGVTVRDLSGTQGVDWADPYTYAKSKGAKGLIVILANAAGAWDTMRQRMSGNAPYSVDKDAGEAAVPVVIASQAMIDALLNGEKLNATQLAEATGATFSFTNAKTVTVNAKDASEYATTQNVIAILEGSDAKLKNEYVAIGAHYDHVGVGRPVNGDTIYNGADDDGSGTVAVMTLAHAFSLSNPRPKRSIMFAWHAGEEKGLWGSAYLVEHPPVPLANILTQLNIDMIGRTKAVGDTKEANANLTGAGEIYIIGSSLMSTQLGALSETVNNGYQKLKFNYKYDAPDDTERLFYRSDHYNYAKKGIPIIFYFDGVHEDYHQPGDSPDKIDYNKMEQVARTVFLTGWELANMPNRPLVDKKLNR